MGYSISHTLFILLFVFQYSATAQGNGTVSVKSSLTANDDNTAKWLSPSGDFAFGFQKVGDKNQFLLSIWYDKIPDKTIVWWYANNRTLITVAAGSKVELSTDRGLVLTNSEGGLIWYSEPVSGVVTISYAFLNDTGNFMIVGTDSSTLWDSFSNPTDTLLPTQTMHNTLYSKRRESDFSRGRFKLQLLRTGNIVLTTREITFDYDYEAYYKSETAYPASIFNLTEVPPRSEYYYRVTLEFDGVLVQYSHPKVFKGSPNWTAVWSQPDNICRMPISEGSGACGYNSYCTLDESKRPICHCPEAYSWVDPNDIYGSCKPNFNLSCDDNTLNLYDFSELNNTNWPSSDYEVMANIPEEDCMTSCLNDCNCAIVAYAGYCWKKKLPFTNGWQNVSEGYTTFLKKLRDGNLTPQSLNDSHSNFTPQSLNDSHSNFTPQSPKDNHGTLILVGSILLGSLLFVIAIMIIGASTFFRINRRRPLKTQPGNNISETNMRCFSYTELADATEGFSEELGRGAFGIVYKGVVQMSTSNTVIAVKKLDRVTQDTDKEFKTEVNAIAQTHHKNLVRLVGYCDEGEQRLLVYEYMVNGTLSSYVFGEVKPSWTQRSHIALGIARGLAYLHEECRTQIIHCDIKPQNILLDEYYNARISDFGLAKLLMMNESRTNTGIRGTKGYVAPEWFRNTPITMKVDVYSFGVMLVEIICCRRNVEDLENGGERDILTDWVWDCFQEDRLDDLVNADEELVLYEREKVERFVMVGIWCIQEDPCLRPTMRKVIQMLEGLADVPKPPCPSPFL